MDKELYLQEIRGVMTRFEPMTAEALYAAAGENLTFQELDDSLKRLGMDIRLVVHDPTRKFFNTYYADYDRGLYGEIYLTREALNNMLTLFRSAALLDGNMVPELAAGDWRSYYSKCVPMAMLIYDFQRRYRDIPAEVVFSVWYSIYKRIDYSNGMWPPEVLDYVFSHAPASEPMEPDCDGLVTIYRGMGELSQPPEQAISWSTHPGNALWFANRSARGTQLAVARVRPEQIIFYAPSFSSENEVIVRPGSVTDYWYEDMIPALKESVPALLVPTFTDFVCFGRQAEKLGYKAETHFELHGLKHILRVLLLSLIYFYNSGDRLDDTDRQILIYFALLHDVGRTNEDRDDAHGARSVAMIHDKGLRIKGLRLSRKHYRIAELLIEHHSHDDGVGEAAIRSAPGLSRKEKEHAVHLYHICKDMDGLDRVRFNGLDYRQLRTRYGRRLPLVAGCLLEEQLIEVLDMESEAPEAGKDSCHETVH